MGVVADDFDGDGRIDLFFTNLVNESSTLFRNLGGMLFVDATLGCGAGRTAADRRPDLAMLRLDADNDGRIDCIVSDITSPTPTWAEAAPMARRHSSFGAAIRVASTSPRRRLPVLLRPTGRRAGLAGDLDNDGRVDLVVRPLRCAFRLSCGTGRRPPWLGIRLQGTWSRKPS